MVLWQRVAQHARDVREWRNGVQLTGIILSSFTWNHSEFKVWVFMKLMSDYGVLVKAYVDEILKSFDKFQVVPPSMTCLTTNLNGPLAPSVSRPSKGREKSVSIKFRSLWQQMITSWVLASIILDTSHGALSPAVLYIGHDLIIIISISLIFKCL